MAAHDARNTNRTSASVPNDPTEEWRHEFDAYHRTPVVADGTAYVLEPDTDGSDAESTVYALDAATGEAEWTEAVPEDREVGFGIAVGDGALVYDTDADDSAEDDATERLAARETESGERRWGVDTPGWGYPTVADGTIFAAGYRGEQEGWVRAFEGASGDEKWSHDLSTPGIGPPAVDGDTVVLTTWYGRVRAYDAESGETKWTRFDGDEEGPVTTVPAALGDNRVYTCHPDTNAGETTVSALDRNAGGETAWEQTVSGGELGSGGPALVLGLTEDRVLYLRRRREDPSTMTTHLTALSRDSGEEQWTYSIDKHSGRGELTLTAESALFTADDRLHVLSLDGEKQWERPAQTVGHKPIVADDRLYLRALPGEYEDESGALVVYS